MSGIKDQRVGISAASNSGCAPLTQSISPVDAIGELQAVFDYIVIGTGFCSFAFVSRILEANPWARILVIEGGSQTISEHIHNLAPESGIISSQPSESVPWHKASESEQTVRGIAYSLGGRSILWSAWCPRPTIQELDGWPPEVIEAANNYFEHAEKLLGVSPAQNIIDPMLSRQPVFGIMQNELVTRVKAHLEHIPSLTRAMAAPLAIGKVNKMRTDYDKFSTPMPLLALAERQRTLAEQKKGSPLQISQECMVYQIIQANERAIALRTSNGTIHIGSSKLILAMGVIPATTLILNSFPQLEAVGTRFTAHFTSVIIARIPTKDFLFAGKAKEFELGALYIAGFDSDGAQFHLQIRAVLDNDPENNLKTALRHIPRLISNISADILQLSKDYVVFICTALGELDHTNQSNWFRVNPSDQDLTSNGILQVNLTEKDRSLWAKMEDDAFQVLESAISPQGVARVEYWHQNNTWTGERPRPDTIRSEGLIHEGSTLWIGNDATSSNSVTGLDYRLRGSENVYVTGAALWPKSGSWNPTLTAVALSQHLADVLNSNEQGARSTISIQPRAADSI